VTPRAPFAFGASSALKGIYVIRYLMFSGGTAIAGAMIDRLAFGAERGAFGLLAGLLVGLVVFRSQLKALWWPRIVLSQDALYLVQRKQAVTLPWSSIASVAHDGPRVVLQLKAPMKSPDGAAVDQIQLEAKKFASGAQGLADALRKPLDSAEERAKLPPDPAVRKTLQIG
jgi:hypothetical protein